MSPDTYCDVLSCLKSCVLLQTVIHEVDQVLVPAFASAAADGAAVIFILGSGARFRMEYPPVLHAKPRAGSEHSSAAAVSLASFLGGGAGAAAGGAPGPDAYGRVGWGGPLPASSGLSDTGVRYSVLAAAAAAPAPAPA